jgi:serine/threonine protein kinase
MGYLPGGSLKGMYVSDARHQMRRATFSKQDAMRWACQLTSAISYMHGLPSPVIHRDIKLENILLTSTNHAEASVKLSDFGLAVQLARRKKFKVEEALDRINTTLRIGTI